MPTKVHGAQHDVLHNHWPHDCCLCRLEAERDYWRRRAMEAEDALREFGR